MFNACGIPSKVVKKQFEGRPNVKDLILNGDVNLIVNSHRGKDYIHDDSYLRKAAIKAKIPYCTTLAAAQAAARGLLHVKTHEDGQVKSIQELHKEIKDL